MTTLTAVLFAGGKSRRMGADKATLAFNGEPLWSWQLKKLREMRPRMIAISARAKPNWCPPDVESILDSPPSRGPLSGIAAVLEKLRTTHLLALAVDLPRMTVAHLQTLWSFARPGVAVMPRNGTYFEPLCAIYPVEALAEVRNLLSAMDFSLQSLARILSEQGRATIHPVTGEEIPLYRNVNAPADLQCAN
jgi:molybdenum cofactor guanylyltransferase